LALLYEIDAGSNTMVGLEFVDGSAPE